MFFDLFGKRSTVTSENDRIWKSQALKLDGIAAQIAGLDNRSARALLVAHFRETRLALESLFQSRSISYASFNTSMDGSRLLSTAEYQPGRVILTQTEVLPLSPLKRPETVVSYDFEICVIVAEHHPLPGPDDQIRDFARSLPCPARIFFHESLDSPLMKYFGSDQVTKLATILGMPDKESMTHVAIDKAIRAAQEKISKKVTINRTADSAEQWFKGLPREG